MLIILYCYPDSVSSFLDNTYQKYSQYRDRILNSRDWQFAALLASVFGATIITIIGFLYKNFLAREKQKEGRKIKQLTSKETEINEKLKKMRGEFIKKEDEFLLREINYYEKKMRDIQDELELLIDCK